MDALIPLLLIGILTIPVLMAILLVVYIAKTNNLSRSTSALEADLAALKSEVSRLTRSSAGAPHHEEDAAEAIPTSKDIQRVPELRVEAPPAGHPRIQPRPITSPIPPAPPPEPPEPEAYVSPFQSRVTRDLTGSGGAAPSSGAGSATGETDVAAASTTGGQARSIRSQVKWNEPRPVPRASRTRAEWESLIGGRLLNWIGALAIIIGIGFFLIYGYQNKWISPALLVAIGAAAGAALLSGGDLSFRKGFRVFSQGLIGAGISVLYLSAYASFGFHLEGQAIAFLMMSAVTVLTFVQAFRFNSLSVSLLGWAGGFLTPVLLRTGQANEVGLFAYISILDVGLLGMVALRDDWVVLQPLTLIATYVTYAFWYGEFYSSADFPTTAIFLTVFWGLFHALDVGEIVRSAKKHLELREIVAVSNAVFYYGALYVVVDPEHHDYIATVTLGLGAVYLVTIAAIRGLHPPRVTEARFALTGAVLLVIATALRFTGFDTVFCWSVEALALILAAAYWKEPGVLGGAIVLYLAAVIRLLAISDWYRYGTPESFVLLINKRALAFLGLAAAGALGAEAIRRADGAKNRAVAAMFDYFWSLLLFVLLAVETQDEFGHLISTEGNREWFQFAMYLAIGSIWMVYALVLIGYAAERGLGPPLNAGLFVAGASICTVAVAGFSYTPIMDFTPILNIRVGAFAVVLIGLLILLAWTGGQSGRTWPRSAHGAFLTVFCLMLFVLCTAETRDYFGKILYNLPNPNTDQSLVDEFNELQALHRAVMYSNLQQVALSLVWLVYSILLIGYGIWRRILSLRIIAIIVFGIAILKIFIYDLSFLDTLYRIFSFIGLGLILLSVSFLYQRFKSAIFESGSRPELES